MYSQVNPQLSYELVKDRHDSLLREADVHRLLAQGRPLAPSPMERLARLFRSEKANTVCESQSVASAIVAS